MHAVRRILGFLIDNALIAAYLALLTALAFAFGAGANAGVPDNRLAAHALAFLTVTAPVIVGFALLEASPLQGTPGKWAVRLRVTDTESRRARFSATLVRNALKFLPWEIAHAGVWHMPGQPFVDPPGWPSLVAWSLSLALAGAYIVSLFTGRTLYDRIAGLVVSPRVRSDDPTSA